jgi:general secretion pathway protein E
MMSLFSVFKKPDPPATPPQPQQKPMSRVAPKPNAQAGAQSAAQPPSGQSESRQVVAVGAGTQAFVTNTAQLPKYERVISGSHQSALIKLPENIERKLCVVDKGSRRCEILIAVDDVKILERHVRSIAGELALAGYSLDRKNGYMCTKGVINAIIENDILMFPRERQDKGMLNQVSKPRAVWESWVECAVKEGATDLHVQVIGNQAEIKIRVDGELEFIRDDNKGVYTNTVANQAVSWAYNNNSDKGSNSKSNFEEGQNIYAMIKPFDVAGHRVAMRFQSMTGHLGPKVTARLLYVDIDAHTMSYDDLGYADSQKAMLVDASNTPSGLILFSGVTGSGKTTTLKTFIETHPQSGFEAFYSIEDPVEYVLKGVHQISVQRDLADPVGSAKKYSEIVAGLMRSDPAAVLMGEIRDQASALSAQQIVETGHMACGTVHAHLISGIIPRLTNAEIGMSRDVLTNPNMLTLLGYQALVPKLCPHCRIQGPKFSTQGSDGAHVHSLLKTAKDRFKVDPDEFYFRNPLGCEKCKNRGTKGLTVVAEILAPDFTWLDHIRRGDDYGAVFHYRSTSDRDFRSSDMTGKTVFEHCLYKALQGQVDPRQCERFTSFKRFELIGDLHGKVA